ncbi:MAG: hypothetical protein R3D57_11640 [Hyphomicrobiaceae bacterium]
MISIVNVVGSRFGDTILGNGAINRLEGRDGADTIHRNGGGAFIF